MKYSEIEPLISLDMVICIKRKDSTSYETYYDKSEVPPEYQDLTVYEISGGEDSCGDYIFIRTD